MGVGGGGRAIGGRKAQTGRQCIDTIFSLSFTSARITHPRMKPIGTLDSVVLDEDAGAAWELEGVGEEERREGRRVRRKGGPLDDDDRRRVRLTSLGSVRKKGARNSFSIAAGDVGSSSSSSSSSSSALLLEFTTLDDAAGRSAALVRCLLHLSLQSLASHGPDGSWRLSHAWTRGRRV